MPLARCLRALSSSLALALVAFATTGLTAQVQHRQTGSLPAGSSVVKRLELPASGLQALTATWATAEYPDELHYRVIGSDQRFGPWQPWSLHSEGNPDAASLLLLPGATRRVEVRASGLGAIRVTAVGYAGNPTRPQARRGLVDASCACPSPAVVGREGWCPDGNCAPRAAAPALDPQHLIVHHSAQTLGDIDFALVVRAIYDYHTGTNGWDDIGYNLLVAPDGTVYEGRGIAKQGAHFCGANAGTLGVCLLGNFEVTDVSRAGYAALRTVSAFVSCAAGIDPLAQSFHAPSGKTLPGIVGHRGGCATLCPGRHLDALIPQLQNEVSAALARGCGSLPAPNNLAVAAGADGKPVLTWAAYAGADAILVERSSGSLADFAVIGQTTGAVMRYTDVDPAAGTNYYRIRVLKDGLLGEYSNEVVFNGTASFGPEAVASARPRLAWSGTGGALRVHGLQKKVDMAFVSDAAGRTVLELSSGEPSWSIASGRLARGQYWLMIFSDNEWFTVPFEYRAA